MQSFDCILLLTHSFECDNIETHSFEYEVMLSKERSEAMRIDRVKLVTELARRDMTQKKLAEISGVSRATINYIRCGKSCSDEIGNKIATALGLTVTEITEE